MENIIYHEKLIRHIKIIILKFGIIIIRKLYSGESSLMTLKAHAMFTSRKRLLRQNDTLKSLTHIITYKCRLYKRNKISKSLRTLQNGQHLEKGSLRGLRYSKTSLRTIY